MFIYFIKATILLDHLQYAMFFHRKHFKKDLVWKLAKTQLWSSTSNNAGTICIKTAKLLFPLDWNCMNGNHVDLHANTNKVNEVFRINKSCRADKQM